MGCPRPLRSVTVKVAAGPEAGAEMGLMATDDCWASFDVKMTDAVWSTVVALVTSLAVMVTVSTALSDTRKVTTPDPLVGAATGSATVADEADRATLSPTKGVPVPSLSVTV